MTNMSKFNVLIYKIEIPPSHFYLSVSLFLTYIYAHIQN